MRDNVTTIKKEVMFDMAFAQRSNGVRLNMHQLTRKGSILECDQPWEGEHCGYRP